MATVRNKQFDANVGSDFNKEETMSTWSREEKVNINFQLFDANRDGGLGPKEMAALVAAVDPRVKFTNNQIEAILEEVYRTYDEFVNGEKGLTFNVGFCKPTTMVLGTLVVISRCSDSRGRG
ncbi:hypothetical protein LguiB_013314 [Lonicera macranthoides]